MKALMISADNFEDTELLVPYYRLREEGMEVDIASMKRGKIKGKRGYEVEVTKALEDVNPDEYDVLILPGGKAPETVRKQDRALEIVKHFLASDKPVSAICHGPQILISAGLMKGRRATCYHSVAPELQAAGALYEDKEVVVDGRLVTARQPSDLPAFMRETMKLIRMHGTLKHSAA
ncbi:MAG: protease [Nitrospirae bacterium GWC2_57_13]|nr:MAG: protease [Nitrospirae bacterium GWC2_57_13]